MAKRNPVARNLKDARYKPRRTPTKREKLLRELSKAARRLSETELADVVEFAMYGPDDDYDDDYPPPF